MDRQKRVNLYHFGNRTRRGDGLGRKLDEDVLRIYLKIFFGTFVPDANAPFRLMKASLVRKYIYDIPDNFYLPNAILAACFSKYREKVIYKVVTFMPRQGGKNYMNLKRIMKIGIDSLKDFWYLKKII